jgi:hypothetical protein
MAKRFFYVSFGILCLVAAYQLGAEQARADWDSTTSGVVVGGGGEVWYARDGVAWQLSSDDTWRRWPEADLPVPFSGVTFFDQEYNGDPVRVTAGDEVWFWQAGAWQLADPFPGGPVSLDGASWGKVKVGYR